MGSRRAIRRLVTQAALAATVVSLAVSAPAAADTDQYGNSLSFNTPCNPSTATLVGLASWHFPLGDPTVGFPFFKNGLAWVDYFGIPVALSPFTVTLVQSAGGVHRSVYTWPVPSASEIPPGEYTLHVLLQGNGEEWGFAFSLAFTTVSATAIIAPGLNTDCTPIATASASTLRAATRKPSAPVLARRVRAARRDSDNWFEGSLGPRATYPKGRFCGATICVKKQARAAWKPITR